MPYRSNDPLRI
jgi:hypothetical protein